jgi:hypothetical protein
MIKLIWISDKKDNRFGYRLLKKFSEVKRYNTVSGEKAEEIIKRESTDFLYLNLLRPANTDVMNRQSLRNINRLRVSIFEFHSFKSRILNFFFPPEIIRYLVQYILHRNKS